MPATVSALRSEIDNPVRGLDDIEVVFDHDDGIAAIPQAMQYAKQLLNVIEVQASGWLIENVQRAARIALGQFFRKLDALCLATRQRRRVLTEANVGQPDIHQGV